MLLIIMAITPNNQSTFSSPSGIKNQPLANGVNIVNGITIVNDKSFFPFGFYYISSSDPKVQDLIEDMRDIAAVGFNTIHASANEVNSHEIFLNEAARLGIYVISEQGIGLLNMINSFKKNLLL